MKQFINDELVPLVFGMVVFLPIGIFALEAAPMVMFWAYLLVILLLILSGVSVWISRVRKQKRDNP